jgi:hypothetical protein
LPHCDGLVLVQTNGCRVRVLNPATRRFLTLPPTESQRGGAPFEGPGVRSRTRQSCPLFLPLWWSLPSHGCLTPVILARETAVPPPYPVFAGQTATYFKGSLLWMINESLILGNRDVAVRGLLRFNLEDESFSVIPAPPGCPELDLVLQVQLAEIRGELCLAHLCPPNHGTPATTHAS